MTRPRLVLTASIALYLAMLGFLGGVLMERMRFDQRRVGVMTRLTALEREVRGRLMELEQSRR